MKCTEEEGGLSLKIRKFMSYKERIRYVPLRNTLLLTLQFLINHLLHLYSVNTTILSPIEMIKFVPKKYYPLFSRKTQACHREVFLI